MSYKKAVSINLDLPRKTPLVVGISGGSDSMALLHMLHEASFERVIVAHIDHQIRKQSYKDRELINKLSKKYGYRFESKKINIPLLAQKKKVNLEGVARDERYVFFRKLKLKYKARFILTAHHLDDQVETVLMNMIRGAGFEGLSGMKPQENDLLRPLLRFSKDDLLRYCQSHDLKFISDLTNQDSGLRRNFLRNEIIPKFKKLNPNFLRTMESNIQLWQTSLDYIQSKAQYFLKENFTRRKIQRLEFLKLQKAEQLEVLRQLFQEIHGHKKNLHQAHLEQVLSMLLKNIARKQKEFGPGKIITHRKQEIFIRNTQ